MRRSAIAIGGAGLALTWGLAGLAADAAPLASAQTGRPTVSTPAALDAPGDVSSLDQPLVVYAPGDRYTYVAWDNAAGTGIELCILVPGATGCLGGAAVNMSDPKYTGINTPTLTGLVVLASGEVVLTGATGNYTVAWASAAGGASFLSSSEGLRNAGNPIADANSFYQPGDIAAIGGNYLGILDGEGNNFSAAAYNGTTSAGSKAADSTVDFSSPPQFTGGSTQIGAEAAPGGSGNEIVVTVGIDDNSFTQTVPSGCPSINDSGYGLRVAAPGSVDSSAPPKYKLLACSADAPVITSGGTDGIGVVEQEGTGVAGTSSDYKVVFRPFKATASGGSFGSPVTLSDVTKHTLGGVAGLDATDDSGTGVYALWADHQGEVLDYSSDGGALWGPPVVTAAPYGDDENMAATGSSNVEIAYIADPSGNGDQVFLAPVSYSKVALTSSKTTTSQVSGSTTGADIAIPAGTTGEYDTAKIAGPHASIATGSVKYSLYSESNCSGTAVYSHTAAVTSGKAASSGPVTTALAAGTYYWTAAYTGDKFNKPSTGACGSEVLTVS